MSTLASPSAIELDAVPEAELVAWARQGRAAGIRGLVQRYNRRLFRAARSVVGNDAEAEDVVQATYVNAFTHLEQFRSEAQFGTWLTRIAINEGIGRVRGRRPMAEIEQLDTERDSAQVVQFRTQVPADPEAEMQRLEIRQALERLVDELPDAFRTVFVLREVEGLSVEETAEQLGIEQVTVRTRLHRARRLLRSAVEAQLRGSFAALYPFDGARCNSMADRVIQDLAGASPR